MNNRARHRFTLATWRSCSASDADAGSSGPSSTHWPRVHRLWIIFSSVGTLELLDGLDLVVVVELHTERQINFVRDKGIGEAIPHTFDHLHLQRGPLLRNASYRQRQHHTRDAAQPS
jgi:hypothetical protein